ncbi:MAG: hypothetical protein J5706_05590 [Elusimicrobiales bacterium]|nr:hypothetical protein [Elusimicrobiales bacterium]
MKKILLLLIFILAADISYAAEKKQPAQPDFRNETIYFLMTDRFADGDPSNNNIYGDEYKPGNLRYYQGGDFKGIIDNLDYIKNMGFTAIWITPPVKQPEGRYVNSGENYDATGYHGYWAYDFSKIDPHLESPGATYKDLINAAHAKGIKIIQDIVLNHGHGGDVSAAKTKWHKDKGVVKGLGRAYDYWNDEKNKWFNHKEGEALADLLDLNDENPKVLEWFSKIYKKYQDMGVDAFRIDTIIWMKKPFWKSFLENMHKNKKDFFIFGEVWTGDEYDIISSYTKLGSEKESSGMNAANAAMNSGMSVLDMPLSAMNYNNIMNNVFKGGDYADAAKILQNDNMYYDPTFLVTFLDNHDKPRFNAPGSPATAEQYKDGLNFYYLSRGIPCVYYGTELQMKGGDDPDNRAMLGIQGMRDAKNSPVYSQIKKLNAIRHGKTPGHEALRKGRQTVLYAKGDIMSFRRDYKNSVVYVFLNKGDKPAPFLTDLKPGTYMELYNGGTVKLAENRPAELIIPAHGALAVYKPEIAKCGNSK